jgi:hypothetical protein
MAGILADHTVRASEWVLCKAEWNSMFYMAFLTLLLIRQSAHHSPTFAGNAIRSTAIFS